MAQFPSSIIGFPTWSNDQVINADNQNSPNAEITALETKVGVDNSSVTTSLDYKVSNPLSDGGGHIQTANKGGTGQTSFTKGDILVASSASVLSKLAVGADSTILVADSSQSTGIKWGSASSSNDWQQLGEMILTGTSGSILASITSGRKDLMFTAYISSVSGNDIPNLTINNDNGAIYDYQIMRGFSSISGVTSNVGVGLQTVGSPGRDVYITGMISNPPTASVKTFTWTTSAARDVGTIPVGYQGYGQWTRTASISSLRITMNGGLNMQPQSRLTIYGKKD